MKIERLKISDIKPWDKNPKIHTDKQIKVIADSIKKFGMNDPVGVWGDENVLVEGHGRVMALKKLKIDEVDAIRLDHLSDEERKAYALAHNQATLITDWDFDLLNVELEGISFDMGDFGFDLDPDVDEPHKSQGDTSNESDELRQERMTFMVTREDAENIRYGLHLKREDNPSASDGDILNAIIAEWREYGGM